MKYIMCEGSNKSGALESSRPAEGKIWAKNTKAGGGGSCSTWPLSDSGVLSAWLATTPWIYSVGTLVL